MNDIPCKCGHLENVHPADDDERTYLVCDGCFMANRPAGIKQLNCKDCWEYAPDNLMYVEQEAKRRKLI